MVVVVLLRVVAAMLLLVPVVMVCFGSGQVRTMLVLPSSMQAAGLLPPLLPLLLMVALPAMAHAPLLVTTRVLCL